MDIPKQEVKCRKCGTNFEAIALHGGAIGWCNRCNHEVGERTIGTSAWVVGCCVFLFATIYFGMLLD